MQPRLDQVKYRLEDEMIADFVRKARSYENDNDNDNDNENLGFALPENVKEMSDQELAVWYNDNVIYPDKVSLNKYYYHHYSFLKDIEMIFVTMLGFKVQFAEEEI